MPEPTPTDAELIAACRRGDASAFEVLYRRHRDWVVALAHRFCGHRDDALDVLQETFAFLLRRVPDLELRGKLTTFLYPVVKHLALDRRKRAARYGSLDEALEPAVLPGFPEDLRDWFKGLGSLQQEILGLRFADGFELKEIAAILGVPIGTVKSRLHNALAALRERGLP